MDLAQAKWQAWPVNLPRSIRTVQARERTWPTHLPRSEWTSGASGKLDRAHPSANGQAGCNERLGHGWGCLLASFRYFYFGLLAHNETKGSRTRIEQEAHNGSEGLQTHPGKGQDHPANRAKHAAVHIPLVQEMPAHTSQGNLSASHTPTSHVSSRALRNQRGQTMSTDR